MPSASRESGDDCGAHARIGVLGLLEPFWKAPKGAKETRSEIAPVHATEISSRHLRATSLLPWSYRLGKVETTAGSMQDWILGTPWKARRGSKGA